MRQSTRTSCAIGWPRQCALPCSARKGAWPPSASPPPAALDELPRGHLLQQDVPEQREPDLRAAADVQAGRQLGPQLINEFANVVTIEVAAPSDIIAARALANKLTQMINLAGIVLPVDTRIVSNTRRLEKGSGRAGVNQDSAPTRGHFVPGMQLAQNQIYVGPGPVPTCSQWRDPCKVSLKGPREQAVTHYEVYLRSEPALLGQLMNLKGCQLMCCRGVNGKCHVDVIIKVFDEMHGDALAPLTIVAGLPWSPREFVERAEQLVHPFDEDSPLDESILRTMFGNLVRGPQAVVRHRKGVLAHYERCVRSQEAALKDKMDPLVRDVVGDKKILLFRGMLRDVGHPGVDLAADIAAGFPLLGDLGMSGVFKKCDRPALLSAKELMTGARWAQESCRATSCRSSGVPETDVAVFEGTMEEVKKRWLRGPLTAEQITDLLGPCWVPSRRFGFVQGSKMRLVDGFSEHGVNGATHVREKITLGGIDECVALAKAWSSLVSPGGQVECHPPSGELLQGKLHPGWGEDGMKKIVGRTWDLKAAYKRL